jgi:LytS/YehU family sensor histidine kinase
MFAIVGFALIFLNSKLQAPYHAGWPWIVLTAVGSSAFLAIALIKEQTLLEFGLPMLLRLSLVALVVYILARSRALKWMTVNDGSLRRKLSLVVVFGTISVFGTAGGVVYEGAVINFRDLGPIMAGILGGPLVGMLVGLVGGAFRYGMGGWTATACFVATVSAGLVSGLFSNYWRGNISYLKIGFLGLVVEGMHLFLYFPLLTLGYPLSDVTDVMCHITVPMFVTNLVGLMIFNYVLERWGPRANQDDPRSRPKVDDTAGAGQ